MAREAQQKPRCLSCLYICCDNSARTAAGIPSTQQLITIGRGRMLYTFIYFRRKISGMLKCIASCSPVKENGAQREADVPADFRMKQRCNHTVLWLIYGGETSLTAVIYCELRVSSTSGTSNPAAKFSLDWFVHHLIIMSEKCETKTLTKFTMPLRHLLHLHSKKKKVFWVILTTVY